MSLEDRDALVVLRRKDWIDLHGTERPALWVQLAAVSRLHAHLPTETQLSLGLGGGVMVFPWRPVGLLGRLRYTPDVLPF